MQICSILTKVCKKEGCGAVPQELAMRIALTSERNLRRAILMLEACRVQQYPWTADQEVRVAVIEDIQARWPQYGDLTTSVRRFSERCGCAGTSCCAVHVCARTYGVQVKVADWEEYISKLARQITNEQSPQQVSHKPCTPPPRIQPAPTHTEKVRHSL
jgi:hypothetical protein